MEGLDDSWNISQFLRKEEEESDDNEDVIPQFDGSIIFTMLSLFDGAVWFLSFSTLVRFLLN
jgi:hypothetical protein